MTRVLVTGAGGQVGLELIRTLVADGHDVHASDIAARPSATVLPETVPWHPLDVTDGDRVEELVGHVRPHQVFHLAAILSARGEELPQKTFHVNQLGTFNVLEAARQFEVAQVLFTSTIAVYGAGLPELVSEDAQLSPSTMYGITKVGGELLGDYYRRRFGVDFRAVRFPGLVSASLPGGGTSDYALFMYLEGLRSGAYEAFCSPDTRIPLMYMPDATRALLELAAAPRTDLRRSSYNIAAFSPTAQELADSVKRALPGVSLTFKPDPLRQAILDSWPRILDDRHAREDWGWKPAFDVDAMTDDLIPQLRARLEENPDLFEGPG